MLHVLLWDNSPEPERQSSIFRMACIYFADESNSGFGDGLQPCARVGDRSRDRIGC